MAGRKKKARKTPQRDAYGRFASKASRKAAPPLPPVPRARSASGKFLSATEVARARAISEAHRTAREIEERESWTQDRLGRFHRRDGTVVPRAALPPELRGPTDSERRAQEAERRRERRAAERAREAALRPPVVEQAPPEVTRAPQRTVDDTLYQLADRMSQYSEGAPWIAEVTRGGNMRVRTSGPTTVIGSGVRHSDAARALAAWWRTMPADHPFREAGAVQVNIHYADGHGRSGEYSTGISADVDTAIENAEAALDDSGERYEDGETMAIVFYIVDLGHYEVVTP